MFKCYRKASQSPIPSWATNQQVLIIFFCAFRNKGEGAPAISDLVQRENNGTGYWIVNMSDSYFGRQQYVIYCSQLRATPSADCNISHIAVFLSSYLILIITDSSSAVCRPVFSKHDLNVNHVVWTHCTLHTARCTLHAVCSTLLSCVLHVAYSVQRVANRYTLHAARCTLRTAHCTPHTAHCALQCAVRKVRSARTAQTAQTAHCTLRTAVRSAESAQCADCTDCALHTRTNIRQGLKKSLHVMLHCVILWMQTVKRYSCSRFTHVISEPHSNKTLSASPISDWLMPRRLSVISITMATTSSDTDGTCRHANTQAMIDKSGFSTGFRESRGKKREFFDQANNSFNNGVGCWILSWLSFSIWNKIRLKHHDDDWIF